MTSLKLNRFDPRTMEERRKNGNPSTCIFIGKRGSGKCVASGTKVLMFDGNFLPVQDIKVGDFVMGDDSNPRKVLNLSQGESIMYKVKQNKGNDYIVNENHILSLKIVKTNKKGNTLDILGNKYHKNDILDIPIKEYMNLSKTNRESNLKGFKTGVEFPEKELPLDPYILGLWLGDSTNKRKKLIRLRRMTNKYKSNEVLNVLKELELINNKHIPFPYKVNSRENRLQLLAGLIDTDPQSKTIYKITHKNKTLAKDIQFLARSLGFMCNIKECEKRSGIYYVMHISGKLINEIPCKIKKNESFLIKYNNKDSLVTGIEIEELGIDKYYGFELDGNHRFLLEDFTVTHNSTLISDIMYYHRSIPYGLIMSGTEEGNGFYGSYFPPLFIHDNFKKELVQSLIQRQKKVLKDPNLESKPLNTHAFLLIDDMMYDKSMIRDKSMRLIFMNGRHWKLLFMLSMQYCMDLPPDLRANVDYLFILKENIIQNQKKLWTNFFGMFEKFSEFQNVLKTCTENYECLVLDNTSRSNKIEDCVYWYKATPDRTYRIGCPELWKYAEKHYNSNYDEEDVEKAEKDRKVKIKSFVVKKGIKELKEK